MGADCSFLSPPAKGIPTTVHMGHAASKKNKNNNKNKNTWTREYGLKEENSKNRDTCYKKPGFSRVIESPSMKHFYRRSKQYDGLETERAEKKTTTPGRKKNFQAAKKFKRSIFIR